jgi:ADP-ribose pyrophosphatase
MPSNTDVDIQDSEICHQGFFRMERLRLRHGRFDGGWTPPLVREVLVQGRAVAVLPYDPVRDEIVLIEQFRCGALVAGERAWMIEIVAGISNEGEELEDVARRETLEETGLTLGALEPVARFMPSPGGSSELVHIYAGRVDAEGAGGYHGLADEGEDIRVFRLPAAEAFKMLDDGVLDTSITLIGLQWLARNRDSLRDRWR